MSEGNKPEAAATSGEIEKRDTGHRFWDTQPMLSIDEEIKEVQGALEPSDKEIRQDPYPLPPGFEWSLCDVNSEQTMDEVYDLLAKNYVEDDESMFRFGYPVPFLKWALTPPGYSMEWHIGVRNAKNGKLLAFITGVPAEVCIYTKQIKMVEINFLCVHKKLRDKRLAPVLIKEVTRRVNLQGIFQAVYTAGVLLPKPVAICRYWHRSLNPLKLVDIQFSAKPRNLTNKGLVKLYRLPEEPEVAGLRPLTKADVPSATKLLNKYLSENFDLHVHYSDADFAHWFSPIDDVVYTYVIENPNKKGDITDLISFYSLPSTIIGHPKYNKLCAAYSYYTVGTTQTYLVLMKQALILAKKEGFDVFNILDILDNQHTLDTLKFGIGDGQLHYYLYNWAAPEMKPGKVGLVLL